MRNIAISFIVLLFFSFLPVLLIESSWAESREIGSSLLSEKESPSCPEIIVRHTDELGKELPLWAILPFVGILLSIAIFPLVAPHFWHQHYPKVAACWALVFAIPFVYFYPNDSIHQILEIYILDYIPFVIMLWSLFTIAGGFIITGTLTGKPITNTILLLIGTLIASWIGTTGASMIMIRPVLRANAFRKKKAHIVCFFIFLVANIGGSLTPLGDPPLFLGFLHGVPFFWTLKLLPEMLFASSVLLVLFFLVDRFFYRREIDEEKRDTNGEKVPIRLKGRHNFFFLAGVVGAIFLSGVLRWGELTVFDISIPKQDILREFIMISMGTLSLLTTKKSLREANGFSWEPIKEVAYLFAGIFMTIIPALSILKAGSEGAFAFLINTVKEAHHYYWITGVLSSFLDNAPAYLTFFNSVLGKLQIPEQMVRYVLLGCWTDTTTAMEFISFLKAISLGSVFMGANTYIGNAPNFMVKSMAEESGVAMPSFFGYMFKYSIPILIPLFAIITFVFF